MKKPTIAAVLAAAVLTGCASPQKFMQEAEDACLLDGREPYSEKYFACRRLYVDGKVQEHNEQVAAAVAVGLAGAAVGVAAANAAPRHDTLRVKTSCYTTGSYTNCY